MNTATHGYATVNGSRLHYVSCGTGPLVVLVHGFPEFWYSWRHQLKALSAAGYRAVAYDQRGYGRSSKFAQPEAYRIHRLVDDAAGLVSALGESKAVIVGHDWGAVVAWTAAWLRPDVFRGVAGLSVPFAGRGMIPLPESPFGEFEPESLHQALAGPGQDFYQTYFGRVDFAIREVEADLRGWMRAAIYSLSGDALRPLGADFSAFDPVRFIRGGALTTPHGAQMRDQFLEPSGPSAWFASNDLDLFVEAFEGSGLLGPLLYYQNLNASWYDLESMGDRPLEVPGTLLIGDHDICYVWAQEAIQRASERIPEYRGTHVLKGCGHWTQQEQPDEVNRLLIDFLRSLC